MSGSMMRVTANMMEDLKLLKKVKASNGRLGTHSSLVHELIKDELKKTHAFTGDGHLGEGMVVLGPAGKPVVILSVGNGKVVFTDSTYILNGGTACYDLKLLANSVEEFAGGLFDE